MERLAPGQVLAHRYCIQQPLGEGSLATSYLVSDLLFGQRRALKLLRGGSPERLETLRNEFTRLAGLYHPALCRVYDFGVDKRVGKAA